MDFKYDLIVSGPLLKEATKAVISAILFHRLLGSNMPQTREIYGVPSSTNDLSELEGDPTVAYPCVSDPHVDALVEEAASRVVKVVASEAARRNSTAGDGGGGGGALSRVLGTVQVRFLKSPVVAGTVAGHISYDEDPNDDSDTWEIWSVQCHEYPTSKPLSHRVHWQRAAAQVRAVLTDIVAQCNLHKSHIPAITTTAVSPFSYTIYITRGPAPATLLASTSAKSDTAQQLSASSSQQDTPTKGQGGGSEFENISGPIPPDNGNGGDGAGESWGARFKKMVMEAG